MVDVQVGVRVSPFVDEVHKLLERAPFPVAIARADRPVLAVGEDAEQELELVRRLEERIALHVEKDVAGRGRRQKSEATLILGREQVPFLLPAFATDGDEIAARAVLDYAREGEYDFYTTPQRY